MVTPAAAGAAPDWKKMKVQELRDELTSRGLDTTGVKSTLIERLETAVPKAEDAAGADGRNDMDLDINERAPVEQSAVAQATLEPLVTGSPVVAEGMVSEALPVAKDLPPMDPVGEASGAAPSECLAPEANGTAVVPCSDLEKKQRRAERFGLELMVSEGEKRRLRAARFGDTAGNTINGIGVQDESSRMSPTLKDAEAAKRKARAARFGIEEVGDKPAPSLAGDDDSKKKARLARFGLDIKLDPQELEKKKVRAARFGLTTEAKPDVEPQKKIAVVQSVANY